MIKITQKNFHNPSEGRYGDCYKTCLACLFEVDPNTIPDVTEAMWLSEDEFLRVYEEWLRSIGYASIHVPMAHSLETVLEWSNKLNPDVYHLLTGHSKNRVPHVVVCLNGQIIWDPSIDKSGIIGPVEGYYWLTYFTPIWDKSSLKTTA